MVRAMEPLEREVKKIEIRRDQETRKRALECELIQARAFEADQVKSSLTKTKLFTRSSGIVQRSTRIGSNSEE